MLHAIEASFHGHGIPPETRDTQQRDLEPRRVPVLSRALEIVRAGRPGEEGRDQTYYDSRRSCKGSR